ncbi:MAG: NADH-quinone oxidoreductase subunit C [Candidatus Aminicenantes bacterium]|nr:NADH-quinone oxidoreductase subunit C [Candidatus Aminicenantes bacterium]
MNDEQKIEKLQTLVPPGTVAHPAPHRIFVTVDPANLVALVAKMKAELDCWYVITISGVDKGVAYEILYHFGDTTGSITVRTQIPKTDPKIPSICGVIPGAVLYERELQDMFGMVVENLPDPRPMLMSDDWPAGNFPLRKDWKFDRPAEIIPGGKK